MTSVLSLTAGTSAGYTTATSMLMAAEESGNFRAISLDRFTQLAGQDIGAMWISDNNGTSYTAGDYRNISWGSLQYDTGSWTDSNSVGLFRVPNDKWLYVQIGCQFNFSVGGHCAPRIVTLSTDWSINSTAYPYSTPNDDGTTADIKYPISGIVRTASGTIYSAQILPSTGVATEAANGVFWIRGFQSRG